MQFVICKKKKIYICNNCFKNEKNCIYDPIHKHPIMMIPKNGLELIRKNENIFCVAQNKDYYELRKKCVNCEENLADFSWDCAECEKLTLCDLCFKKSLEDENFKLKEHKKEHSFYRNIKKWKIYNNSEWCDVIENS